MTSGALGLAVSDACCASTMTLSSPKVISNPSRNLPHTIDSAALSAEKVCAPDQK